MLNLDTHIFLDAARNKLERAELALLRRQAPFGISAIVLWEVEILYRVGRIQYGLDSPVVAAMLESVVIWPLDVAVCLALLRLDFKADPADEIIAATSLAKRVPLLTQAARLRGSALLRRHGLLA